jgi:2-iminobutanoate/2-iminopropanoate deaminase
MSKIAVATDHAPGAIGPYSQAVKIGHLVFCSGQIALDPKTGELVQGGIEAETARVLDNLTAVLAAAGASFGDVVRTTIYLTDLSHFGAVNRLYGDRIGAPPPARTTIQVAALPRGGLVEIDAIAHIGKTSSPAT